MKILNQIIAAIRTDARLQILLLLIAGYLIYRYIINDSMNIDSIIKRTAKEMGMPANMQNLIVAQAKHETANYTSNAFVKNKNLFGYKYVGSAYQLEPGITSSEGNAYGAYATIEDSVRELCEWIRRRQDSGKFPKDLTGIDADLYAQLLKNSGYYGDPVAVYAKGLKHFLV